MSENVIELIDVVVEYDGRIVLDMPHLELRRGEILTLLGENGSGKTTLLRLLGLLIRPARGSVVFAGEEVDFGNYRVLLELRRRMAAVMQDPLLCRMSVRRNVALGLRFRGLGKVEIDAHVNEWLERYSISHLSDRPANKLSGGEAQRTSLARAMVLEPDVFFLDEPFAALDAPTRQDMLLEFKELLGDTRPTTVFATHDRSEAFALGDRVAVLLDGRVAQLDEVDVVFARPSNVQVARFIGYENVIPGRVTRVDDGLTQVDCDEVRIETEGVCEAGADVHVVVRSEDIVVHDGRDSRREKEHNSLNGQVTKVLSTETHYRVEIDCGVLIVAVVSRTRTRTLALEAGREVVLRFPPRAAHVIRSV